MTRASPHPKFPSSLMTTMQFFPNAPMLYLPHRHVKEKTRITMGSVIRVTTALIFSIRLKTTTTVCCSAGSVLLATLVECCGAVCPRDSQIQTHVHLLTLVILTIGDQKTVRNLMGSLASHTCIVNFCVLLRMHRRNVC